MDQWPAAHHASAVFKKWRLCDNKVTNIQTTF